MSGTSVQAIRQVLERGDCVRALELWNQYVAGLRADLAARRLTAPALAETAELVAWSRPVLLCARAHARDRLRSLLVAGAYAARTAQPNGLIRESF